MSHCSIADIELMLEDANKNCMYKVWYDRQSDKVHIEVYKEVDTIYVSGEVVSERTTEEIKELITKQLNTIV